MNRRSESYFSLSQALEGFVNHKYAEGLTRDPSQAMNILFLTVHWD